MLHINERDVGGVTVLNLDGSMVGTSGLDPLSHRIKELVAEQRLHVVVNAASISVIDSSDVGDLVGSFTMLKKAGGSLKVAEPKKMVREVLRIARIPTIIEVFDTEDEAVKAFGSKE
jgi:anti-sigma B factor antagonist